jgi:hypothetical protein
MKREQLERMLEKAQWPVTRFGAMKGTLRKIKDHADLEALRVAGIGFVANIRPEGAKVHRVGCESLEAMSTSSHPKVFCEAARELATWLANDPTAHWEDCGVCGGGRSR